MSGGAAQADFAFVGGWGERAGRGRCNWLGVGEQKGLLARYRRCSGFKELALVQRIVLKVAHCLNLIVVLVFLLSL